MLNINVQQKREGATYNHPFTHFFSSDDMSSNNKIPRLQNREGDENRKSLLDKHLNRKVIIYIISCNFFFSRWRRLRIEELAFFTILCKTIKSYLESVAV